MELYQLAYFVEVARQKNFTRAAEKLHLAQPALSQQVQKLEAELGTQLFVRGRKLTQLTAAGEAFLPRVQQLLAMAESARQAVSDVVGMRAGRLVLASVPTLSACLLPSSIKHFRAKFPQVELVLREGSSGEVMEMVENSTAEAGFLQLPVNQELFEIQILHSERFYVVVSRNHPLAARKTIRLTNLSKESFVFYKGMVRQLTLDACRQAGFEPKVACESTELETVRALVLAELGVAVLPRLAMPESHPELRCIPLIEPKLERTLAMIGRKGHVRSIAAQAFLDACQF